MSNETEQKQDERFQGYFTVNDAGLWVETDDETCTALYSRPAPRKPFVRLSEEEITELAWAISQKLLGTLSQRVRAVRAIEDALEEKNK